LHRVPCTLNPAPCTSFVFAVSRSPLAIRLLPLAVCLAHCSQYRVPCTVYPAPCTLHRRRRRTTRNPQHFSPPDNGAQRTIIFRIIPGGSVIPA
jgi:hypothetical protein